VVLMGVLMISSVLLAGPATGHSQRSQVVQASSSHTVSQPGFFQMLKDVFKHLGAVTDGAIWG
jgi:hypothetical protein